MRKTSFIISTFLLFTGPDLARCWSWDSAENVLPSLREDLDKEIEAYRAQVLAGMIIHDRIIFLDRLIDNYKPMGLNLVDLETERSRLILEERQQQLRQSEAQDQATILFDKGVAEYRDGQYKASLNTFQDAERLLPNDSAIKELRRKLRNICPIVEVEAGEELDNRLVRLTVRRYLENDPKRAMNAILYANDKKVDRPELIRLRRLIEADHPETEATRIPPNVSLLEHKMQLTLEAIYDGRYLSAIAECNDVLDLEPNNVLALTRLGSAYFAMNEKDKAKQIWTQALQHDPNNDVLRKFLYGSKGSSRVETR